MKRLRHVVQVDVKDMGEFEDSIADAVRPLLLSELGVRSPVTVRVEIFCRSDTSKVSGKLEAVQRLKLYCDTFGKSAFDDKAGISFDFSKGKYVVRGQEIYLTASEAVMAYELLIFGTINESGKQALWNARRRLGETFLEQYISEKLVRRNK